MSATQKDFYGILGVTDRAELVVIRAAYKALMMIYHPDKHKGDNKEFIKRAKDINEAYTVLMDPDKRKKHDAERRSAAEKLFAKPENAMAAWNELKGLRRDAEEILSIINSLDSTP